MQQRSTAQNLARAAESVISKQAPKATRKAARQKRQGETATMATGKKGKSMVPQSKSGRRK